MTATLNSLVGSDRAAQRTAIIAHAASQFDSAGRTIRTLTSRRAFVNDALRQQGLTLLAASEPDAPLDTPERTAAIANSARTYDGEPGLKVLTDRDTFIDGELRHRGMVQLTRQERERLR